MALDNAQFISELSIVDPPGTDPLSQGDDQIRTIKRATQQSFPNIDAAVTLTPVQMNLAAIKNEANIFTAAQTIKDADVILDAATDIGASYRWQRAGLDRWTATMGLDVNANDWSLTRFDILGAFVDNPMIADGVTGVINFAHVPTIQGDPVWSAGEVKMLIQGASLPSTNWFVMNGLNGTIDIRDRLIGAEGVFNGNTAPFLAAKTDAGATAATTLALSQVPDHGHRLLSGTQSGNTDTVLSFASTVSNDTVIAGNRENTGAFYIDDNNNNELFVEHVGGGGSHVHALAELNVEIDGPADAFQVMPFSYFMQMIQYVP